MPPWWPGSIKGNSLPLAAHFSPAAWVGIVVAGSPATWQAVDVLHSDVIFLGIQGSVVALHAATGEIRWTVRLKGSDFVNVVLDGDNLYATTQGEIFCLDPQTGEGRWHNPLKGLGLGLISIAGAGLSASSALQLMAERRLREQQDSSAAAAIQVSH
jgi:outer membrane protein assembly factor BamB